MVVAVDLGVVLVVRVLRAKDGGAHRACEVLNMILVVERSDVAPAQGSSTGLAHKVESPEIVALTEWILFPILLSDGKEL